MQRRYLSPYMRDSAAQCSKALNPTLPVATCLVDRSKALSCPLFSDFVFHGSKAFATDMNSDWCGEHYAPRGGEFSTTFIHLRFQSFLKQDTYITLRSQTCTLKHMYIHTISSVSCLIRIRYVMRCRRLLRFFFGVLFQEKDTHLS